MTHFSRAYGSFFLAAISISLVTISPGCTANSTQMRNIARQDLEQLPNNLWQDGKKLVTRPENATLLLLAGGASGYVRCAHDDRIEDHFENRHTFGRDFTIGIGTSGNPATHFALAGSGYLYGLMADDANTREVSRSLIEALSLNGLLTVGLKTIAQDRSPNGEFHAWPSGHTSSTVTVATVMNEYYGPWVGLPLYALSGFVMYERMETGEHWASDVVFGAVLGYTVGKTVADRYKPKLFGMDIIPYIDPGTGRPVIGLAKQF